MWQYGIGPRPESDPALDQTFVRYHSPKDKDDYGQTTINGWITKFFPYHKDDRGNTTTNAFNAEKSLRIGLFPSGVSQCDVIFNFAASPSYPLLFMAGFIGIEQDPDSRALRPQINWLIKQNGEPTTMNLDEFDRNLAAPVQRGLVQ